MGRRQFVFEEFRRNVPDDELIADVVRTAQKLKSETITMSAYNDHGLFSASTLVRRFGSWPKVLTRSNLKPSRSPIGISTDDLFTNLLQLWIGLGRQPRYDEVRKPSSRFSAGTYENRFGTWQKALKEFVEWANDESEDRTVSGDLATTSSEEATPNLLRRGTQRAPSDKQRFSVFVRDGFRCQSCGASPLTTPGVELHVDHVVPWSKGGDTVVANLQTKCAKCNLGKGNAFNV